MLLIWSPIHCICLVALLCESVPDLAHSYARDLQWIGNNVSLFSQQSVHQRLTLHPHHLHLEQVCDNHVQEFGMCIRILGEFVQLLVDTRIWI